MLTSTRPERERRRIYSEQVLKISKANTGTDPNRIGNARTRELCLKCGTWEEVSKDQVEAQVESQVAVGCFAPEGFESFMTIQP